MDKKMVRGAILIAISVVLQMALRELNGLGPAAKVLVGICINATLILTVYYSNKAALILNAVAAPVIAVIFGAVPSPVFIYPVVAANLVYGFGFAGFVVRFGTEIGAVFLATLMRSATFMIVGLGVLMFFKLEAIPTTVLLPFTGIQLITGFVGGLLALFLYKRIGPRED